MKEKDITQNVFPKFDILPHPLRRIGHALLELGKMHQLASHGDHLPSGVDEMLLGEDQRELPFDE